MFARKVTEDLVESKASYRRFAERSSRVVCGSPLTMIAAAAIRGVRAIPFVELTPEGREYFGWRWAAVAMETT